MATREQVRLMTTAQPFQPFTVKMNSGAVFTVTHPELVSCSVDSRSMYLNDAEGIHLLEMLLIEEIKEAQTLKAKQGKNGE